ncbi:group II intron reverse transcriptase/maturase [Massilia cavernae]|uniref:Group II intron reverse transcriptase/maturase n=2 Tax=Massilia cavernae TaxID=2320864 RepID=A0A418Y4U6_9BURK|nr:group II intron reverse transcriptase/maturase [Massilia cavernae]
MEPWKRASLVSATTKQEAEGRISESGSSPESWTWVEGCVWTEAMLAALGNGVKGGKWFSLMDKVYAPKTLAAAWQRVQANAGACGVDQMSVGIFAANSQRYLTELSQAIRSGSYEPQAIRRVTIAKAGGGERPLGIPTVKDRIAQTALKLVLEPVFEREFLDSSYGFRPQRGCKDALREVQKLLNAGRVWVVDADLKSYFDTISHEMLMEKLKRRIADGKVLHLIERYLQQEIVAQLSHWVPTMGSPQGAVISPLLANVYLHDLDQEMANAGYKMVRYADDFVVLCESQEQAQAALARVTEWVQVHQLTLHPDKTHNGNCMERGQGFDFLGYRFEAGHRNIRRKSINAFRDKVRALTRRNCGQSLKYLVDRLNPMLKGWLGYFKHAKGGIFANLDGFVRRRLRSILCKHNKLGYYHRSKAISQRWPKTYFANLGLFTLYEARAAASQPRCGNSQMESRMRENRTYGSEGGVI